MTDGCKKVNIDIQSVRQINVITDRNNGNNFLVCLCVCVCVLNFEQIIKRDPSGSNYMAV
jgi:hypothetical protein